MRACLSIVLHASSSFSPVLWLWAESTGMAHEKKGVCNGRAKRGGGGLGGGRWGREGERFFGPLIHLSATTSSSDALPPTRRRISCAWQTCLRSSVPAPDRWQNQKVTSLWTGSVCCPADFPRASVAPSRSQTRFEARREATLAAPYTSSLWTFVPEILLTMWMIYTSLSWLLLRLLMQPCFLLAGFCLQNTDCVFEVSAGSIPCNRLELNVSHGMKSYDEASYLWDYMTLACFWTASLNPAVFWSLCLPCKAQP